MSDWFEWLVGGSKHGSLQRAASEQLVKVLNLVEEFIMTKKGETFERDMKVEEETALTTNGNLLQYQIFLLKTLAKLFKNKPEEVIVNDGNHEKQTNDQFPNIFITKQKTFGETDYDEKVILNLRIGDKIVWKDVSLPEALAGIVQVYFCFNLLYPPEVDDFLQFAERIICNFGSDGGARNKRNSIKKGFRDFQVSTFSKIILIILKYFL